MDGAGQKPATFKRIFEEYSADRFGIHHGEYLRGDVTEGGVHNRELYLHAASMPSGGGKTALAKRLEKVKGAQIVAASIASGYGRAVAENVLRAVHEKTNREVWKEVTRGDLRLLNDELKRQLIKDELAGNWASAAKEQHYLLRTPGGANVVEPSSGAAVKPGYYPAQGLGDAEVVGLRPLVYALEEAPGDAKVAGPRPLYGIKEEYSSIQWPDSDARVGLRDAVHAHHIERGTLQFDEEAGMLILVQGEQGGGEQNKRALTSFIGRHFEVEPGNPAFQNIANNILSYLPRGEAPELQETARRFAADAARRVRVRPSDVALDAVRRRFTLEVEEGNVVVGANTEIPYRNVGAIGHFVHSMSKFVRQEGFEISGEHLKVDPTAFDAKANLLQVARYDFVKPAR